MDPLGTLMRAAAIALALWSGFGPVPAAQALSAEALRRGVPTLAPIVAQVADAVVTVVTLTRGPGDPARPNEVDIGRNSGSGVIVDAARGYVLTNAHVVADVTRVVVELRDGRAFDARILGTDEATDIAVLAIEPDRLVAVQLGTSATLQVGDFVLAVGNPFGLGQTVTGGIISALRRGIGGLDGFEDFIQTDAAVNPGSSGGALVDMEGRLIGLTSAIIGPGANIGIAFAVPIDLARLVMDQLIEFGEMRRARIGLDLVDLSALMIADLGHAGAMVYRVAPGSSAAIAGLRPGDVIPQIDGVPVRDARDLFGRLGVARVGTRLLLTVRRGSTTIALELRLDQAMTAAR